MQPVNFHLNFVLDLASDARAQMQATLETESVGWPADLVNYAKSIIDAFAPAVIATAGRSGKAIVLISGNMSGQLQYVVSRTQ